MKNHALYILLKQIATDGNYTVEHVEGVTKAQIESLLDTSDLGDAFVANMKRSLANCLRDRDDEATMQELKGVALAWLDNNFPDAETERGREHGKPFIKIFLEGK